MPAGGVGWGGVKGWREGKGGGKLRDFAAAAALGVVSFLVTQFVCGGMGGGRVPLLLLFRWWWWWEDGYYRWDYGGFGLDYGCLAGCFGDIVGVVLLPRVVMSVTGMIG